MFCRLCRQHTGIYLTYSSFRKCVFECGLLHKPRWPTLPTVTTRRHSIPHRRQGATTECYLVCGKHWLSNWNSFSWNPYSDSGLVLHFLLTNVLIVSHFGQKCLLNALNVNVNPNKCPHILDNVEPILGRPNINGYDRLQHNSHVCIVDLLVSLTFFRLRLSLWYSPRLLLWREQEVRRSSSPSGVSMVASETCFILFKDAFCLNWSVCVIALCTWKGFE